MEATKRERIILLGVVPIASAAIGAILTVVLGHYIGGDKPSEVMLAIVNDHTLSADDKAKLMTIANEGTTRFWGVVSSAIILTGVVIGGSMSEILRMFKR